MCKNELGNCDVEEDADVNGTKYWEQVYRARPHTSTHQLTRTCALTHACTSHACAVRGVDLLVNDDGKNALHKPIYFTYLLLFMLFNKFTSSVMIDPLRHTYRANRQGSRNTFLR